MSNILEKLPKVVRVGGFDIRIELMSMHTAAGMQRYGEFSSVEQTIRLQREMPSRFKAVDTLLHEINHAIYWAYGLEDDDKEERIVGTFGTAQMALFRDNPWLTKWIGEALK